MVDQLVCRFVNQMMSSKISAVDLRSNRFNSEVVHISSLSSAETLWLCQNMEQFKRRQQINQSEPEA